MQKNHECILKLKNTKGNKYMKCINCGKYPFCKKIEKPQQEACENFIKRPLGIEVTRKDEFNNEQHRK